MRLILTLIVVLSCFFSCNENESNKIRTVIFYSGKDTCFKVGSREQKLLVMLDDIEIIKNTLNDTAVVNNGIIPPGKKFKFFNGHSKDYLFDYEICCKSYKSSSGKLILKYVLKSIGK